MSVKITSLEVENIKRIKAVSLQPNANGLTVIGGSNGQGKTSVLDAIAWALGGDRFAPSSPQRDGSVLPPHLTVTLSNGIVVERKGKNSALYVKDPSGKKGGQALLNSFISQFALDLPRFLHANSREKADTLLRVIGVGDALYALEDKEARLYNERHAVGRIRDQKAKFAKELPDYPNVPNELLSASDLIRQQQDILARNGENERKRQNYKAIAEQYALAKEELYRARERFRQLEADLAVAKKSAENLTDESTAALEQSIADIEETNRKIRANLDKDKAETDAAMFGAQYDALTRDIEDIRAQKYNLLNSAQLPLEGLSVENRELTYNGYRWDSMSGSEQLRVATAIIRKLNPDCGFVLLDKLEQMDVNTLHSFGEWLEQEGLQAIATRVSNGDECSIIIEDGAAAAQPFVQKQWKKGEF